MRTRSTGSLLLLVLLAACGSATDTGPVRYNFAVVDGLNQHATAGAAVLGTRITSQLARDPQGRFASSAFDWLLPAIAYAQGISVKGDPVPGTLVCARQADPGEPKAEPLCAFTLADGKAPIEIKPGTKAGVFNIAFTAQVQTQEPVKDSTTVTVEAGPMASHRFVPGTSFGCWTVFPADYVQDQYGNPVPYRFVTKGDLAHTVSDVLGSAGARTFVADKKSSTPQPVSVEVATGTIASGQLTVVYFDGSCVDLQF